MKISICIPTYNRAQHLANCLQSIIQNRSRSAVEFEVCVSDNCSTDDTEDVVRRAQASMAIKYQKNSTNLGIPRNFLNVVEMAQGEFVWLIGDDDLLLPDALEELDGLINGNPEVEFFYVNSYHLDTDYVLSYPQPFDTANLPDDMAPFSSWNDSGELMFMDLVNPDISFDFLGGMFLSVFRRQNWIENAHILDVAAIEDMRIFSHFDNTFPHVKIFARAFAGSKAYFNTRPLNVCLGGAREWDVMYPFVSSVRLVESVQQYRNNGLPLIQFIKCKNFALRNFIPDFVKMSITSGSGFEYVKPLRLIAGNCLYPNFYFSLVYFLIRKLRGLFAQSTTKDIAAHAGKGR